MVGARALYLLLAPLLLSSAATANIVASSTTVTEIAPAAGSDFAEGGAFETGAGSNVVQAFSEAESLSVSAFPVDLQPVDLVASWSPGDSSTPTTLTQEVNVYYLHLDTQDGTNISLSGFVEFDAPVLGLLVETASLDATDGVVSPQLFFDPARVLGPTDALRLEAGDRRLVFSFLNGAGLDSVRVVTSDAAVSSTFTEIVLGGSESFVEGGVFEGDGSGINTGYWFAERMAIDVVDLGVDLDTSALQAGWMVGQATQPALVTARVDSYYVFFDSVDDTQDTFITGTITFPGPVLGVAFTNRALAAGDPVLGVSGVGFSSLRQLGSQGDGMQLEPDGRTLRIDFVNADATDDVRILVATQAALPALSFPALCTLALALLTAAVAVPRARQETTKPPEP
jgi:hypothetical protein